MPSPELLRLFLDEAARHLAAARRALLATPPRERDLLRHLHSVKGMALSLAIEPLASRLHEAEELATAGATRQDGPARRRALLEAIDRAERDLEQAATTDLPPLSIATARLDRLLDQALTLSAAHQRLEHRLGPREADPGTYRERTTLARAVRALRDELLDLRLLPARDLLPPLRTALARWSRGRPAAPRLEVTGEEVQLDRAVAERLIDPLGHLLRNALVHGIEPPGEREAAGKPPEGTIALRFRHEGARLAVRVEDDGRGIEPREVLLRARRLGLPGAARAARVEEALGLLASPGMGSGREHGPLAGRGVGLAAVRAEVERLGGELRLASAPGRGFSVALRLPHRLALLDLMLVTIAGRPLALPLADLREIAPTPFRDAAVLRPVPPAGGGPALWMLLATDPPAQIGVDRVAGRRRAVVRPLGAPLDHGTPWLGAALLPEGGLALVVDPPALARTGAAEAATMAP